MGGFLQYREYGPTSLTPLPLDADPAAGDFHWCLLCERTFRSSGNPLPIRCPTPGCEGGVLFEPLAWSRVRAANPDYPPVPLEDVAYPFFGAGTPDAAD